MMTKFTSKVGLIAKSVCVLLVGFTLITKLLGLPPVNEQMQVLGLSEHLLLLGLIEGVALALYIIPRTANIGFFLLCAYYGGAIAVNLHKPVDTIPAIVFLSLIWLATYLRKPELFKG